MITVGSVQELYSENQCSKLELDSAEGKGQYINGNTRVSAHGALGSEKAGSLGTFLYRQNCSSPARTLKMHLSLQTSLHWLQLGKKLLDQIWIITSLLPSPADAMRIGEAL